MRTVHKYVILLNLVLAASACSLRGCAPCDPKKGRVGNSDCASDSTCEGYETHNGTAYYCTPVGC